MQHFEILVDKIGPNQKYAWTTDHLKINENRNLLRKVPFANSTKLVFENGTSASLFSIGRYITVVRVSDKGIPDKMYYFDYDWEISSEELKLLLPGVYSEELEKKWFDIQYEMYRNFTPAEDIVRFQR